MSVAGAGGVRTQRCAQPVSIHVIAFPIFAACVFPRFPNTLKKNPHMPLEKVFPTPYSQKNQEMWLGVQLRWVLVSDREEMAIR